MRDTGRTVFLHMPKTGGWWVHASLRLSLQEGSLYAVPSERVGDVPLAILLSRYPTVVGHFTWRHLVPVLGDSFTFTFLRDPVDRAVSLYYFYRRQAEAPNLDPWVVRVQRSRDFDGFVDDLPDHPSPWSNWQTWALSGSHDGDGQPAAMLERASRHLDRLDMVGVQDDLEGGFRALGRLRGWSVQMPAGRVNTTPGRPGLEALRPRTLERLRALNRLDAALFDQAASRWAGRQAGHEDEGRGAATIVDMEGPVPNEFGTREIVIDNVLVDVERGHIAVEGHSLILADDVTIGIRITNSAGLVIFGTNTHLLEQRLAVRPGDAFRAVFRLDLRLVPDTYMVTAAIHEGPDHLVRCFHWIEKAGHFVRGPLIAQAFAGLVDLHAVVDLTKL